VSGATGTVVKAGLGAKLLVPAICTLLGAAGSAATHAYLTASRPQLPVAITKRAPPRSEASPEALAPEAVAAPAASAASDGIVPALRGGPTDGVVPALRGGPMSVRATQEPALPASLRSERLLLESATAALMRGDNAAAMASLQKHAHQYPRGALSEEREVLWIKVLRAQGNDKAAEQRARDFKRRFPASLQQGAIEKPGGSK
jgi:TolA-binding protein